MGKVHGSMFSSTPSPSKKLPGARNKIRMALESSDTGEYESLPPKLHYADIICTQCRYMTQE